MRVITRSIRAKNAALRWRQLYGYDKAHTSLRRLGDNPDPDEVDHIIGNKTWTEIECDECGDKQPVVVVALAPAHEDDGRSVYICRACLVKAVASCDEQLGK